MTDLERNFEKSQARVAQLEEDKEAAEAQLAELTAQVTALTADVTAATDEAALIQQDLDAANVSMHITGLGFMMPGDRSRRRAACSHVHRV